MGECVFEVPHGGCRKTRAKSAFNHPYRLHKNGTKFFEPPLLRLRVRIVTSTGSDPVTFFKERKASTKVSTVPVVLRSARKR